MDQWLRNEPGRIFHPFPMFHGGGICIFFHMSLWWDQIPVLAPNKPLTPEMADEFHRSGRVNCSFLPPAIMEGISKNPEFTRNLKNLRFVAFSGAPLAYSVGDIISKYTRIINLLGQTETASMYQLYVEDEDYLYCRWGTMGGVQLQQRGEDTYEVVVVRDEKLRDFQPAFMSFPHLTEVRTNDLMRRHPDPNKSDYWIHCGRADDIVVFDNDEKLNPISMEHIIAMHPKVRTAMIVGEGRFQAAVIIELQDTFQPTTQPERDELGEEIWPFIEQANVDCPAHGRLVKQLVLFADPKKPFLRTGKESLKRRETTKLYLEELDNAYAAIDVMPDAGSGPIAAWGLEQLQSYLRERIEQTTHFGSIDDDTDFFRLGMDSLQVLELSRGFKSALAASDPALAKLMTPSLVYTNSNLRKLSSAIFALIQKSNGYANPQLNGTTANGVQAVGRTVVMDQVLDQYTQFLPLAGSSKKLNATRPAEKAVILTGSTGGIGSYVLGTLMSNPSVTRIYCLNRSADASSRQHSINKARGLPTDFESKVKFLRTNFSRRDLGLSPDVFDELLTSVTHIIHNAWAIWLPLATIDHSFVSSLGSVVRWNAAGNDGPVPERIIEDMEVAEELGYAESKHVSERVLHAAHQTSKIETCIFRVGQVAGPVHRGTQGEWTRGEWFPTLIASSRAMGVLPSDLDGMNSVTWVPVDILAESLVELALGDAARSADDIPVYHLVNPAKSTWESLWPVAQQYFQNTKAEADPDIKVVPYHEWLKVLQENASVDQSQEAIQRIPAIKILDFYESLDTSGNAASDPEFSTQNAVKRSPTLQNCGTVKTEWMELWLKQWNF
ncbi:uncharacterized protein A1O5_04348 [Cladophialophora psammophila CBS 110553]|uniref:Polyketide synthase-like phosphopantetheine-binding domain-containing protein n=1 Tax=Cladophialophora psammophila CBS 110553 TaxID=1182543 RepID=W9WUK8_9EURO|nr:uncharacterized protein A1O5_04348 [Cladophialophora psammophila CBS 110553]EXJ71847.1 hypothetical protein A1O5_04348 [Cladophialophora psammophila CBS 110553]